LSQALTAAGKAFHHHTVTPELLLALEALTAHESVPNIWVRPAGLRSPNVAAVNCEDTAGGFTAAKIRPAD
jgi:hypothetical protein